MIVSDSIDYSFVTDRGPIYFETMPGRFIVEPWNSFSSLLYLIPAFVILWQIRGQYKYFAFLSFFAIPLLLMGGIGSTLYHAFRTWRWMMFLDVLPIFMLTMGVSAFFMQKLIKRWWIVALIILLFLFIRGISFGQFELQTAINISYLTTGMIIFVPALLYAYNSRWHYSIYLVFAAVSLSFSLFFRFYDDYPHQIMSAGTHWLWHLFSAAGALLLGIYLMAQRKGRLNQAALKSEM